MGLLNPISSNDLPPNGAPAAAERDFSQLVSDARAGCSESLGQLIEGCRSYLLMIANGALDDQLRIKVAASDLVQETLCAAGGAFERFTGENEQELRWWLRRILLNKLASARRTFQGSEKRQIANEISLEASAAPDNSPWLLADERATPRQLALAKEESNAIRRVLTALTARHREVIERRCFELQPFGDIGLAMNISGDAARKLWCRAIEQFRLLWEQNDESG